MEKDLLQAVIKVEAEIQQSIESERKKAADWLESVRISLSREFESKKQEMEKRFVQSLETTGRECELKAAREIAAAEQMAGHLQNLPESILQDVVREYLDQILPPDQR